MFENAGEIVILVLAVIVTWIVARASADRPGAADRTVLSGLRAATPVPPAGSEPEFDLIRVIHPPDIARTA